MSKTTSNFHLKPANASSVWCRITWQTPVAVGGRFIYRNQDEIFHKAAAYFAIAPIDECKHSPVG